MFWGLDYILSCLFIYSILKSMRTSQLSKKVNILNITRLFTIPERREFLRRNRLHSLLGNKDATHYLFILILKGFDLIIPKKFMCHWYFSNDLTIGCITFFLQNSSIEILTWVTKTCRIVASIKCLNSY